jgi:hypothetical protein
MRIGNISEKKSPKFRKNSSSDFEKNFQKPVNFFSRSRPTVSEKVHGSTRLFMELLGYHSNLNPLSVLDDESPTTKSRREKGGFILPLEPVQGESHQGLLDWHLRRSWDAHVHLEFGDRFPVRKVAFRHLFVLFVTSNP